jgi:hypothetical protein
MQQEEIREYASNVLKRRVEELQSKDPPKLTHLRNFSAMIRDTYSSHRWTPQALREFYIEIENLLTMLKSHKDQETDEAIITIFGVYSALLKNIRKYANSKNARAHPTTIRIVSNVIPPRKTTYPDKSFIWRILGYTYDVINYSPASDFSKAVDYFINRVAKEAITIVSDDNRTQVNKYDIIVAIEKVKKASMKTFIDAKKNNAAKSGNAAAAVPPPAAAAPSNAVPPPAAAAPSNAVPPATSAEINWKNHAQLVENELEKCRRKLRYYRNKCKIANASR